MKKLTILLAFVMTIGFSFTSCMKEKSNDSLIEGKWTYSQKGIETSEGEILNAFGNEKLCSQNYVEFLKDGVVNEGKYSYNENCDLEVDSGTWFKNEDEITIVFPKAGKETAEILTLDEKTLKIRAKVEDQVIIYVYKKV